MHSTLLNRLGEVLREVAQREIAPRFQQLAPSDVFRKPSAEDPHDVVTAADRAAEAELTLRLPELVPGSTVVGEEAVAADASVLARLRGSAPVWVVDPLDGTKNFAAGHGPFGSMVALVERGTLLAAGIYLTEGDNLFLAERGLGAFHNGERILLRIPATGVLKGTVNVRYMPPDLAEPLNARAALHTQVAPVFCAAHEYTETALCSTATSPHCWLQTSRPGSEPERSSSHNGSQSLPYLRARKNIAARVDPAARCSSPE